jgi:hypothetical protein
MFSIALCSTISQTRSQAKRLELMATLTGLSDLAPPPKQLASEKTIRRFQETIRDNFISNDTTVTKSYLRFLLDRILVHEGRIEIRAKLDVAPVEHREETRIRGGEADPRLLGAAPVARRTERPRGAGRRSSLFRRHDA